jgi:GAF domain-containing protein
VLSQEKLLALIGRIYDAAADPSLWPAFLQDLAVATDANPTALIYHDMSALRASFAVSANLHPECQRRYIDHYSAFDPFREAWLARFDRAAPEAIQTGEQLVGPELLKRTEWYNDFATVHDVVHHLTAPIAVHATWAANLSCNRSRRKGPFGPAEVYLLQLLFPHLQRAIQFHRRFAELEGRQRASLDALDHLSAGVVLLDRNGCILAINREGRRILDQNDGLTTARDGLRAALPRENRSLRATIAAPAGGTVAISKRSGKRPLLLLVSPVGRHAFPAEMVCSASGRLVCCPCVLERGPSLAPGSSLPVPHS